MSALFPERTSSKHRAFWKSNGRRYLTATGDTVEPEPP